MVEMNIDSGGMEGIDWKRCHNPKCDKIIKRKDCYSDYVFKVKLFHDIECRDSFNSMIGKEVRLRTKKQRSEITKQVIKEQLN